MKATVRIIALSTLLIAGSAHAMQETVWDFRGNVPQGTTPQHLTTVQVAEQGMYVQTQTDGLIQFPALPIAADSATITLTNIATPRIALLWRSEGLNDDEYFQQNITLPTGSAQEAVIDLASIAEWDPASPMLGLAFPAGAEVLIEKIEWRSYSTAEKLWNRILSFWTPDKFKMYSINFLWGPLIGSTPEARDVLFDELPPRTWSATRAFYALFALALVGALVARFSNAVAGPGRAKMILLVAGAALWILFDARMTQEIVSYAARDWSTYVLASADDRVLRSHANLYDVLERLDALLGEDDRYALVTREGTPFFANVRYTLYPAVPVAPAEAADVEAWIVLGMPGVTVVDGALVAGDGTVLAASGSIVERFDDSSFFYRAR